MPFPSQNDLVATKATLGDAGANGELALRTLDMVDELRDPFTTRDKMYKDIDDCIYLNQIVDIPDAYVDSAVEVRSPLPMHIINTVTAALSVNPPQVTFDKVGAGDAADENVALRQNGFNSSWKRQEIEADRQLFRLFTHSVTSKGEGILKTMERKKSAWGGYDEKSKEFKKALDEAVEYRDLEQAHKDRLYSYKTEEYKRICPYPIFTTDVPPEQFYYLRNEFGMTHAAEVKEVPVYTTLQQYGVGLNKFGQVVPAALGLPLSEWGKVVEDQGSNTLRCIELWAPKVQTIILQAPGDFAKDSDKRTLGSGYIVKQTKHGYCDPFTNTLRGPYFHCFGVTTSSRTLGQQGLSILAPFLHLFPLLNSLLTIQGQAAYNFGYPAFKRTKPPEMGLPDGDYGIDPEEATSEEEIVVPGHIYPYDIAPIDQPRTSADLDKTIAMVRQLIDLALPSVVQGQLNAGDAGYAINQAAHLARLAWDPIVQNEERALSRRTGFESWLIENKIKEGVQVYGTLPGYMTGKNKADEGWLAIKPADLNGVHNYKTILQPETPQNEALKIRSHSEQLKLRIETPEDAIRDMGRDPVAVKRGWMKYEIENDPALKGQQRQRILKRVTAQTQEALAGVKNAVPQGQGGAIPPAQQQQGQPVMPPNGATAPAPQVAIPQPPMRGAPTNIQPVGIPGTVPGQPAGIRGVPPQHAPLPGENGTGGG